MTNGQTKFHIGEYEVKASGKVFGKYPDRSHSILFKADSTFKHYFYIGCGGYYSYGNYHITGDTVVLDTGMPIVYEESFRNDDSLQIIICNGISEERIPNFEIEFKTDINKSKKLLSDNSGVITIPIKDIESLNFNLPRIFSPNENTIANYKIVTSKGRNLKIIINQTEIIKKEYWRIIDEYSLYQPKVKEDNFEHKDGTYIYIEK